MKQRNTITAEELRALLDYDPATGEFRWKEKRSAHVPAGSLAGTSHQGYVRIHIAGRLFYAHRLAWLYMTGRMPGDEIDHRNGVRSDNRFENLRDIGETGNRQNLLRARSSNKSGLLGVHFCKSTSRWRAGITVGKKNVHLGRFDTKEEAHEAYVSAKRRMHEGCAL